MPLGYAVCSIAGVNLKNAAAVDWKNLILDGVNFRPTTVGNTQFAADGTPHTQLATIDKGIAFGIKAEFATPDVLDDIFTAVETAMSGAGFFAVTAQDDLYNISENCVPDYAQGFVKHPEQRTNEQSIKEVVFRFITV